MTLNSYFEIEKMKTSIFRELMAGLALFMSLSYIFIVNPAILSQAGIPSGAVFFATVVASGLATLAMGVWARLPFALAPGLEANGFMAFVVVATLGFTWQQALGIVFWSGVLCVLLTWLPYRQRVIDAIPEGLKAATATTIGVFVAIIGFVVTDLIRFNEGLPVGLGDFTSWTAGLLAIGLAISAILSIKAFRFPGAMFIAIVVCSVVANSVGVVADSAPANISDFTAAVGQIDLFSMFFEPRAWTTLLVFFMIDFYGSIGKFIALTRATNLQSDGVVKNIEKALYVDGYGTIGGSLLGTSTIITYVESAVGIAQGGRTGLVAVVCGILMLASLAFAPIVSLVPVAAVSGVLVYVAVMLVPWHEVLDALQGRKDKEGSLSYFDLFVMLAMGVVAGWTFSLDKSLLLGFAVYSVRDIAMLKTKANPFLYGSALLLGVAMFVQYFILK